MQPSKVIRNPYLTTRKPHDSRQKRPQRPWETNTPTAESGIAVPQPQPQPQPSIQFQPFVAQEQVQSTDDSFDCGIDWDAAVKTLEEQSAFDSSLAPRPPPPGQTVFLTSTSTSTTTTTTTNSSSSDRSSSSSSSNSKIGNNNAISSNPSSSSATQNLATATTKQKSHASNDTTSAAISDLRPSSWTATPQESLEKSALPVNEPIDPDQQGLPKVLRFQPQDVAPVRDIHQKELVKNADISSTLLNGWTLYNHQKRAVLKGLAMRRCILALDMGLGKTCIGCVWSKALVKTMKCHVVVLCPVSLQEEWKRSMENAVGLTVKDLPTASKKKGGDPPGCTTPSVSIHSWSKIPTPNEITHGHFVVVGDEAHSIQNIQATRTKDTLKLINSRLCKGVLLLTGTPMKNGKPSNLFPLLKAVHHPLGRNQKAYEAHFCGGREVNFGRGRVWQATGASNLESLRRLTKSHLLHLTKEACLKDLPPLSRVFVEVPVSSRRQIQHNQVLQKLAKIYESKNSGADEKLLGAIQNVRMVGSLAKVDAAVEQAKSILMEEPAVVIFTSFQEVAKQVHRKLSDAGWQGEILTGETPAKNRQSLVDKFQKGLSPVFCCTFGAGGVGLTLTAAHSIILLDRPWTPGDAHQAEDRVRRIGQTKPVKSIWLRSFDLDVQIDEIIEQKNQTAATVLTETSVASGAPQSAPRLSIFQMLKSVLPEKSDGLTQTTMLQFSQELQENGTR